jgi:transposase InsO family protein
VANGAVLPLTAAVMDLYSRGIVGWAMRDHLRTEVSLAALRMAIPAQRRGAGREVRRSRRPITWDRT